MRFKINCINALKMLRLNKMRSFLTILGVIIAVATTVVVVSLTEGFSNYVSNFLKNMGTNAMWVSPDASAGLQRKVEMTPKDIEIVRKYCDSINRAAPLIIQPVRMKYHNRDFRSKITGTSPDFQYIRNFYVDIGRFFGPIEIENESQVCVLGRDILKQLKTDDGMLDGFLLLNNKRFKVIGILEEKGSFLGKSLDDIIIIPYTTATKLFPITRNSMPFVVQAKSPQDVPEAQIEITRILRSAHHLGFTEPNDFRVFTQDEALKEFHKVSSISMVILVSIVGVSLLVGGIGIMNIMLVSVTERTREIGIRKAVGAKNRDILMQFLTEAVLLSFVGGLIGIFCGYVLTYSAMLHPDMVPLYVPYWAILLGVGFSIIVGVIFGMMPAIKAAKLLPIDALRFE